MRSRRADLLLTGALAALAYIPLLLTRSGQVAADTKEYLYLDPGRLTSGAASMWDPNTGLGTVTHQNIGYLLPMGPFYTLVSWLGIPVWVGQRIWMGSLLLAAGTGAAYASRKLGLEGAGRVVAAFMYMLSPYTLDYLDRISAILMPWAALGWMVGVTIEAARRGGWRYPALFALVVALVGGVNATSIVMVIAAPALWLVHAVWVSREIDLRRAAATAGKLAVLCIVVSAWWAAGLWAEGRYGINVLRVTETVPTVSRTSSAAEVLRGLGYWYFYGWDKVQPWTLQSVSYLESPWLLVVSFLIPALSLILGWAGRWVYRSYCLALVAVGTVIAVGAYPFSDPSLFGAIIKGASAGSELALAMRSVDRIVPIVLLGLCLLAGSGLTAIQLRLPAAGLAGGAVSLALVAANLPALWTGGIIASNLSQPGSVPSYWTQAAGYLNRQGTASRVFGLPGEDFAAYSWGVTQDPVANGLLDRGYVTRQVVPTGSPAAANLLEAIDEPIQEGTFDFSALAPLARLMSVGQILLQSDLQFERYHLPLPQILYRELTSDQARLPQPVSFGPANPAPRIHYPLDSELRLGIPTGTAEPPALSVFDVADPRSLVRAETAAGPIVLAGDGRGIVEAAGAGILSGDQSIFYAADEARDPARFAQAMGEGATLVVTDTNLLSQYQWGSLQANVGAAEKPGTAPLADNPSFYTLPVFAGQTAADQTVAEVRGIKSVVASQYGDSLSFDPESQALNAFDGDSGTAWVFGAHEAVGGIEVKADLENPVTAGEVTLHQIKVTQPLPRSITSVTLLFDGGHPVRVRLTPDSWSAGGQTVRFPSRKFTDFELVVNGATGGADKRYDGLPSVGFSDISIPGVASAAESLRLPTDLLSGAGPASLAHPLDILLNRLRAEEPPRHDPEESMSRTFDLPTARTFSVSGTVEVNPGDSDYLIDQMVGLAPPGARPVAQPGGSPGPATVVAANSSTRLDDDRNARANAAVDGDPKTAWIAETGPQDGEWIQYFLSKPITFRHLDLQVLNDGRHSLPSSITISTPTASETVSVPVPAVGYGRAANSTTTIPVDFAPLAGSELKITINSVHQVRALDYYATYAGITDILPVGLADLGLAGVIQPATPTQVPPVCTSGLLTIDGRPVDVQVTGTTADALAGDQLSLSPCGNSTGGVSLSAGGHTVTTSRRLPVGWSIDQLWLGSAGGGGPASPSETVSTGGAPPSVRVTEQGRTSMTVAVTGTGAPSWLVLGQSFSSGWTATGEGGHSLGPPQLIDAFANGWPLPAIAAGHTVVYHLHWDPQNAIWAALLVSGGAIVVCALMAVWPERAERRSRRRAGQGPMPASWAGCLGLRGPGWARGSWCSLLLSALVWGLATAAVSRPAIGITAALAVVLGLSLRWGRAAVRLSGALVLLALPLYVVEQQAAHRYWPSIDWPGQLSLANDIAWTALALVGSDLVVGAVYARRLMAGTR